MALSGLRDYSKLVEFPTQRKLFSLLSGQHQGVGAGSSQEFLDMAEYKVGDPIGDIDWKASARHAQPILKRFESTAVLNLQMIVDLGANMAALSKDGEQKALVAQEFATAIAWMASARGDMLGMVAGNRSQVRAYPARSGLNHAQKLASAVVRVDPTGAGPDLDALLRRFDAQTRRRSMVFIVTDAHQLNPRTEPLLRRLLMRHAVYALPITDLDPTVATQSNLSDIQMGALPDFVRGDPALSYQWQTANRRQRELTERMLQTLRVPYAYASTRADVLDALIEVLGGGRRGSLTA